MTATAQVAVNVEGEPVEPEPTPEPDPLPEPNPKLDPLPKPETTDIVFVNDSAEEATLFVNGEEIVTVQPGHSTLEPVTVPAGSVDIEVKCPPAEGEQVVKVGTLCELTTDSGQQIRFFIDENDEAMVVCETATE